MIGKLLRALFLFSISFILLSSSSFALVNKPTIDSILSENLELVVHAKSTDEASVLYAFQVQRDGQWIWFSSTTSDASAANWAIDNPIHIGTYGDMVNALQPNTTYNLRAKVKVNGEESDFSDVVSGLTQPDQPMPTEQWNGNTVRISWSPVAGAKSYYIEGYYTDMANNTKYFGEIFTSSTSYEVNFQDAIPASQANLIVGSSNDGIGVGPRNMSSFAIATLQPPVLITAEALGVDKIKVKWQPYSDSSKIDGFYIYLEDLYGDSDITTISNPNTTEAIIDGLTPGRGYTVEAAAYRGYAMSDFSNLYVATNRISSLSSFTLETVGTDKLKAKWQLYDNKDQLDHFNVIYDTDTVVGIIKIGDLTTTECIIERLFPNTKYDVYVRGYKGDIGGDISDILTRYTLAKDPKITSVFPNSFYYIGIKEAPGNGYEIDGTVSTAENPAGTKYAINVAGSGWMTGYDCVNSYSSSEVWFEMPEIKGFYPFYLLQNVPNKTLTFLLKARNGDGIETASTSESATTAPGPPTSITITNVSTNSAYVSWNASPGAQWYNILFKNMPEKPNDLGSNFTSECSYSLNDLNSSTTYEVYIEPFVGVNNYYGHPDVTWVDGGISPPATFETLYTTGIASVDAMCDPNYFNGFPVRGYFTQTNLYPDKDTGAQYAVQINNLGTWVWLDGNGGMSEGTDPIWQPITMWPCNFLFANNNYQFRSKVKHSDSSISNFSDIVSATTPPEAPKKITINSLTPTSITFTWDKPAGAVQYFVRIVGITEEAGNIWRTTQNTFTCKNLIPNYKYDMIEVAAWGDFRKFFSGSEFLPWWHLGMRCYSKSFTTPPLPVSSSPPPAASASSSSTTTAIQVSWSSSISTSSLKKKSSLTPSDVSSSGTEYYCENTTAGSNSGWITGTSWSCTGLQKETNYSFRVKARASGVESDWTDLGTITTKGTTTAEVRSGGVGLSTGDVVGKGSEIVVEIAKPTVETSSLSGISKSSLTTSSISLLNVKVSIDGIVVTDGDKGSYDSIEELADKYLIKYKIKSSLSSGAHEVKVEAEDTAGTVYERDITGLTAVSSTTTSTVGQTLVYPSPYNPSKGNLSITYTLANEKDVTIYIFDSTARVVWKSSYAKGTTGGSTGYNAVEWNGMSLFGSVVANGMYLLRVVETGTSNVIGKTSFGVLKM